MTRGAKSPHMKKTLSNIAAIVLLAATAAGAPAFDMGSTPLDTLGIKARIFKGAKSVPAVTIEARLRKWRRGEESWEEKVYPVRESWRARERGGEWSCAAGATMEIARIDCLEPESEDGYETAETLNAAFESGAERFAKASADDVAEWLRQYAGISGAAPSGFSRLSGTGGDIPAAMQVNTGSPDRLACIFKVRDAGSFWFYAGFSLGAPVSETAGRNLLMEFLRGCGRLGSRSSAQQLDSRYTGATRSAGIQDDPRRAAAKKAISGVSGWWWSENADYIFLSDLPQARGAGFIRETQRTMSLLRKAYQRYVLATKDVGTCVVRLFADEAGYNEYLRASGAGDMSFSIGLWSPAREELLVQYREDRASTLETMRHEAFHQYLHYATGRGDHMQWFNEGHAALFENVRINSGTGQVRVLCSGNRAQWVEKSPEEIAAHLAAVRDMSYRQFYAGSKKAVNLNYVSAWALCYFLSKGCHAVSGFEAYRKVIPAYLDGMAAGLSAEEANAKAWETVANRNLALDFLAFWKKRKTAEGYEPR